MKKETKELLATVLFCVCFITWITVCLITPIGGWNPNTPQYNVVYKQLFAITGLCTIGSLFVMYLFNSKQ